MIDRFVPLLLLLAATGACGGGSKPATVAWAAPVTSSTAQAGGLRVDASDAGDGGGTVDGPVEPTQELAEAGGLTDAAATSDVVASDAGMLGEEEAWCPEGIETLPGPICVVVPKDVQSDASPTLVIFLHGVTNVGSGWQIALIKGMANYAKHQKFALFAPRAPRQPPVEGKPDIYAWRTSTLSAGNEEAMLDGWTAAKAEIESRSGHSFKQVFVMGFSSGAYYVSSLALRGRLDVDGYAAFAGGSAPYSRGMISQVKKRVPIFVGYGLRDKAGSRDARGLVSVLRRARWEHRVLAASRAGHTITTRQFTSALAYLREQSGQEVAPAAKAAPFSEPAPRGNQRRGSKHRVKPRR